MEAGYLCVKTKSASVSNLTRQQFLIEHFVATNIHLASTCMFYVTQLHMYSTIIIAGL